jgi:retron-type reverse transcriptase
MIPKPNGGGERALGIPTIRDRVVQTAAKLVLEPIFEADFEDNAHGYRPARGAVDAVKEVHRHNLPKQYPKRSPIFAELYPRRCIRYLSWPPFTLRVFRTAGTRKDL